MPRACTRRPLHTALGLTKTASSLYACPLVHGRRHGRPRGAAPRRRHARRRRPRARARPAAKRAGAAKRAAAERARFAARQRRAVPARQRGSLGRGGCCAARAARRCTWPWRGTSSRGSAPSFAASRSRTLATTLPGRDNACFRLFWSRQCTVLSERWRLWWPCPSHACTRARVAAPAHLQAGAGESDAGARCCVLKHTALHFLKCGILTPIGHAVHCDAHNRTTPNQCFY